ncbi:hypothetical protein Cgig2_028819 [Carnegiea gigantea]|uniref:non-specific serine/threonine protein kinase n=1 Tax=Carnegiea gigantea TaxID=171969 RepID=A0A9Q1QMB3_9CARY|nr:hypothetical protein Cgig2_028819 [Carnegiea gigantea]
MTATTTMSTTMEKKGSILMQKYELGRELGRGTFAKVYYARNLASNQSVAIKVVDKEKILKVGLINQIKREISVMRLVKHPNIVELYEVMASKTKIYFVMEYVKGGELFNKISKGRLKEGEARKYFQQLIGAIEFCHSRGVYHRDLKPENLLLDDNGNLKITDFGLSALHDSRRQDGLLHTTCGTPAYVAPEVINQKGYDGAKADIWSCGVVLYVLLAGFLPFHDTNLMELYKKISKGEFKCPGWFPPEVRKLLSKILDPNPEKRITVAQAKQNPCTSTSSGQGSDQSLKLEEDINSKSDEQQGDHDHPQEQHTQHDMVKLNAFEIISSLSPGFDLRRLFETDPIELRFTTAKPPAVVISRFEEVAKTERFSIEKNGEGMVKLRSSKEGRKGQLAIDAEIFEVAPTLHVVEVKKVAGDTIEYNDFYNQDLRPALRDIVWTWQEHQPKPEQVVH